MAGCSILIRISPIRKEKQKPAKRQVFIFGGDGEYPLAFFQRKNRGICQRSHWRMNTPLGCSILIRISPSRREKRKPAKRQVSVFGGDGEYPVAFFQEEKQRYPPVFALADEHPAGVFEFNSNLSIPQRKTKTCQKAGFCFWRRWRDSNSRRAFDPYTISNRARSTNYATSPCLLKKTILFTLQLVYYNAPGR